MRELSFEDVQQVSGGSDFTDGAALILTGVTIAKLAGILVAGVVTSFVALPLTAGFALGLVALGGYHIGRGIVTVGADINGASGRDSDC